MRPDYSPAFLALILGGIAVVVLGLLLVTAHSQARPESLTNMSLGYFLKDAKTSNVAADGPLCANCVPGVSSELRRT
jgi:hypothetical protein